MKKLLLILIAISTTLSVYFFFFSNAQVEGEFEEVDETPKVIDQTPAVPSDHKHTNKGMSVVTGKEESTPLSKGEIEQLEARFDEIEKEWLSSMEDLFINQLELSRSDFREYKKMREGFEKDSTKAYENFHEEMVKKHGDSYSYNPTEDEEAFQGKIRKIYEDSLLKKLGKEKFRSYLQLKDSFNERLIENSDPEESTLLIEF